MMNCLRLEKDRRIENIIIVKDVFLDISKYFLNISKLKKEIDDNIIKDIRNIFRLKNENEAIKGRIIRDIRNSFELENEEENYQNPRRNGNFYSSNYLEQESTGDRNNTLSIEAYLNKIRPYIERSDTWKIQLTVVINLVSSKDTDEDRLIHSKNDNIKS